MRGMQETIPPPNPARFASLRPVWWHTDPDGHDSLQMIDQTRLPGEVVTMQCDTVDAVWHAIKRLSVRGAPAIGVTAAYGIVVALDAARRDARNATAASDSPASSDAAADWRAIVAAAADHLATSRPTAVNLFWALDRMRRRAAALGEVAFDAARRALLDEAHSIRDEDAAMCRAIGDNGHHLIPEGAGVLTHCNAGALATAEYGTALALMYAAHARGRRFSVFVDETRPLLQGSRLTAWELRRAGIDATLICDNMAATVMRSDRVQLVVTGADRIAANGDTANKIGTYGVAVLARAHDIPFYVAAPSSTFDLSLTDGMGIPIEERDNDEVRGFGEAVTAPKEMPCFNPAFDVTPAQLITGIITEKGIISPVTSERIREMVGE